MEYDPPLDRGICTALRILQGEGVETFESCEGGPDHAYTEPTVRFHGDQADGNGIVGLRSFYPVLKSAPPTSTATKSKKAKGKGKTKKLLVKKDKNQRIKPQPVETSAHKVVYQTLADGELHSRAPS